MEGRSRSGGANLEGVIAARKTLPLAPAADNLDLAR